MHYLKDKQSAGFTLIELMIAMTISGIISAAMYSVFQAQVRGQISQDVSLSMTQGVRFGIELMASDIRMAGCDPRGAGTGFELANADELIVTMDTGGGGNGEPDGIIQNTERVRYGINASGNLGREQGGAGGLQPIALNCGALNFVYLDAAGFPGASLEDISAVEISIVVGSAANESENPGFLRKYTDNVSYVNLQGDEILAPQNDSIRRFQLSETIDCRNL